MLRRVGFLASNTIGPLSTNYSTISSIPFNIEEVMPFNRKINGINDINNIDYFRLYNTNYKAIEFVNEIDKIKEEKKDMTKTFKDFVPMTFGTVTKTVAYYKGGIAVKTKSGVYKTFVGDDTLGEIKTVEKVIEFPCVVMPTPVEDIKVGDLIYLSDNLYFVENFSEKRLAFSMIDAETNEWKQFLPMAFMGRKYFSTVMNPLGETVGEFFKDSAVKDYFSTKEKD